MAAATRVLDDARFEARARIGDIVAVLMVVAMGAALLFEMYTLGYSAGEAVRNGGELVLARDRSFVAMIIEACLAIGGLSWIVYRLLTGGARRIGG